MDLGNFSKLYQRQQPFRNFVRFITFAKFLGPFNQVNAIHSYYFANMFDVVFNGRFSLLTKFPHIYKFRQICQFRQHGFLKSAISGHISNS